MTAPLHGLVLAGGLGTRMGCDKASMVLRPDGLNQAQWALRNLSRIGARPFLSLRSGQPAPAGCAGAETIRDQPGLPGPLAGILAAFAREPDAAWLVLACDMPSATAGLLEGLASARCGGFDFHAYASAVDGLPEPLCAVYEPTARAVLLARAAAGCVSPRRAMASSGRTQLLQLPADHRLGLENLNTPEGLARFQSAAGACAIGA